MVYSKTHDAMISLVLVYGSSHHDFSLLSSAAHRLIEFQTDFVLQLTASWILIRTLNRKHFNSNHRRFFELYTPPIVKSRSVLRLFIVILVIWLNKNHIFEYIVSVTIVADRISGDRECESSGDTHARRRCVHGTTARSGLLRQEAAAAETNWTL